MSFIEKYKDILLITVSILVYFFIAYFLERSQFPQLFTSWLILFGCFLGLIKSNHFSTTTLMGLAIIFRLIFLFSTPNLSQDFYRFIWDGRMILEGFNPYLSIPASYIQQDIKPISEAFELYQGMGEFNGSHYTNYPPLNQLCFLVAALFSQKSIFGSIIVLRCIIILADVGIYFYGKKLLKKLHQNPSAIFWYLLNPFIIIEMTGNLHFEPVMLFFLMVGLYQLYQQKWIFAALFIGCAVSVKLIPLLFLPLFFQWLVHKKDIKKNTPILSLKVIFKFRNLVQLSSFYVIVIGLNILLFLPFYSVEFLNNYTASVGLWFKNFEFNASFYYLLREIGYLFRGYNEIAIIGKITTILVILFLLFLSFFRKNKSFIELITAMLFAISFYYFTTTTVHPWYLATPLLLSVFTKYRFPVVWTLVVILSYQFYANLPWKENFWFIFIEYILLYTYFFYEIKKLSLKKMSI